MAREAKFFGLSKLLALIDTTLGKLSPKVPALANPKSGTLCGHHNTAQSNR